MIYGIEDSNVIVHKQLHEYIKYDYLLNLEMYITSYISDKDVLIDISLKDYQGNLILKEERNYRLYLHSLMRKINDVLELDSDTRPFGYKLCKTLDYFEESKQSLSTDSLVGSFMLADELFEDNKIGKICTNYTFRDGINNSDSINTTNAFINNHYETMTHQYNSMLDRKIYDIY